MRYYIDIFMRTLHFVRIIGFGEGKASTVLLCKFKIETQRWRERTL